jgi:hypothetical protein
MKAFIAICALIVLCALAIGLGGSQTHAQNTRSFSLYTGKDLYAQCFGNNALGKIACRAYIMGSFDQLVAMQDITSRKLVCGVTSEMKAQRIVDVVKDHLAAHPEDWRNTAASIVGFAIMQAFPCGKSQRGHLTSSSFGRALIRRAGRS